MPHYLESLTPLAMLEIWGLRISGTSFKEPLAKSTGRHAGIDDELSLVMYIESTNQFAESRPVLVHVFSDFLPISSYRYREPGETRMRAAIRHGQANLLLDGWSDARMAQKLFDDFLDALIRRQREQPFKVPARPEEITVEQIVAQVEADLM